METPLCFESDEQFEDWLKLYAVSTSYSRLTRAGNAKAVDVCQDCTPSFASCMRLKGRCEHPELDIPDPRIEKPMFFERQKKLEIMNE